jgi:transforming growth factor-beta-induced protein
MVVMTTACNKEEEYVQPQEELPDFITTLESFDEEVEYAELSNPEARFKSYSWKKKFFKRPTYLTLAAALKYTKLFSTVVRNKVTVFAPDDKAFAEMGIYFWNVRRIDKDVLTDILLYHTAEGFIFASDLPECSLNMLNGSAIGINFFDGKVLLEDASDTPSQVVFTDRKALNTVFHGIDRVLTPPDKTIAEIVVDNPDNFSTLLMLLQNAGLDGVVADPDQNLTVFAPTNEAFGDVIEFVADNFDGLDLLAYLEEYPEELEKILLHHVSPGSTFSFCLSDGTEIPTLNTFAEADFSDDSNLQIVGSLGFPVGLIIDKLNIHANNGVIHAIDFVLLPDNLDLSKPL